MLRMDGMKDNEGVAKANKIPGKYRYVVSI